MPLVFSAITPHPPVIIPTIGGDDLKKIKKTETAFNYLEEKLYASHPDCLIVISPHGSLFPDVFTINFCAEYTADFNQFGDIISKFNLHGDFEIAHRLRDATKREQMPATMVSEPKLDHGSAVPLYYLTRHLPDLKILQLGFCDLDYKSHIDFGKLIKEQIAVTGRRVAVIASGDMSHALSSEAPAGFNKRGPEFDEAIRKLLREKNLVGILKLDKKMIDGAAECGLRSILILLGILSGVNYEYRELAYEAPFGVGYLTAECELS